MIIWIIFLIIIIIDLLLCAIYSRMRRKRDFRKQTIKKRNVDNQYNSTAESNIILKLFKWIDNTMYGLCRYTSICLGYLPSHTIRRMIYKYVFCMKINRHAIIHGGGEIRSPWNVVIGNSVIGVGAILDGRYGIEIEDDVVLATGVWIWTEEHDAEDPYFRVLDKGGKVTIKRHVWIGNRVVILPKITVNEGAVLAASSVVTKDCDSFTMYGGVPAKEIHKRNNQLKYSNVTKGVWPLY